MGGLKSVRDLDQEERFLCEFETALPFIGLRLTKKLWKQLAAHVARNPALGVVKNAWLYEIVKYDRSQVKAMEKMLEALEPMAENHGFSWEIVLQVLYVNCLG